jgi:hypothetical protein
VARVLVLDAGSFLVSEHVQNLSKIGLNTGGAVQVASNTQDPGGRTGVGFAVAQSSPLSRARGSNNLIV